MACHPPPQVPSTLHPHFPLCLPFSAAKLRPVMLELAFNLESFNPAFTAVLLKVQSTIGLSGYHARDEALKRLILPLAGEYGLHADQPQGD